MSIRMPRRTRGALAAFLGATLWLASGTLVAQAGRFGPPWQSRVSVEQTTLFSQADRASPPVGPLTRGAIVVVVNETTGPDGTAWTQVPDGWLLSSDVL